MFYINFTRSDTGNYGNPHSPANNGDYALPDALLQDYLDSMGFVHLEVSDDTVTRVTRNVEAYDAYIASLPPEPPPVPPEPSAEDTRDALLVDHELRITMLELGL